LGKQNLVSSQFLKMLVGPKDVRQLGPGSANKTKHLTHIAFQVILIVIGD